MATQVASLFGTLDLVDNFTPGLHVALGGVDNFTGRLGQAGAQLTAFGATMGQAIRPAVQFANAGISTAASFDSAMAEISARTGIVGQDLNAIRDFALQMGADTAFSAQDAADGFLQLLSSGQSAAQAMQTLPVVLDSAAASGESLGRTADTLTDIMAAYNLEVGDARMVSDALARAAGASSADIASLGQGFANVGGVANAFGLSVTDTAAVLAIFSENGIKGAEAGTQLKSMLLNMSRDTEKVQGAWESLGFSLYDAWGNARPLNDVIRDLNRSMADMSVQEQNTLISTLAGSYGQLGLRALLSSGGIGSMTNLMSEQTSAAEVAAARMDTFKGSVDSLQGSVETLQIRAFTPFMNNVLKPLAQDVTGVVNLMSTWASNNPKLTTTIIGLTFGLAGLAAAATFGGMALTAIGGAAAILISPLGLLIGLVAVFGAAFSANFLGIRDAAQPVIAVLGLLLNGFGKTFELLLTGENAFDALRNGLGFFVDDMARAVGISEKQARGIQRAFMDVTRFIQNGDWAGLGKMVSQGMANLLPAVNEGWAKLRESAPAAMEALGGVAADATDWLVGKMANFGELIADNGPRILGGFVLLSAMVSGWIINTAIPELAGLAWSMASSFAVGFVNGITNNGVGLGGFTASILSAIEALPSQAAGLVSGFGPVVLQSMSSGIGDAGQWALMSVVIPVVGALTNPTNWALAAAAGGVLLYQMGAMNLDGWLWATTHVITPIVLALTNPESWAWAGGVLGVIVGAMGMMGLDAAAWTMTHLISPIVLALTTPENWAWAAGTLGTIFTALAAGAGNAANFVTTKIIDPIKNAVLAQANTIYNAIASIINDAIPDSISLNLPSVDLGGGFIIGGGNFTLGPIPNPIAMRAMGGPVMAGRPYIVGEKGPELMVPSSSGEIVPNHELGRGGGRGAITIYGDVSFYGVNDIEGMYDQLEEVRANRGN